MTRKTVEQVKKDHESDLLKKPGVVGLGIGEKEVKGKSTGKLCLKVYVEKKLTKKELSQDQIIPNKIEGYETDVVEVGKIETLPR
jgi:hypothetical protein